MSDSYKVKNFGNDSVCSTREELRAVLKKKYAGKSVAIHTPRPSGVDKVDYVDVSDSGEVSFSFGARAPYFVE